MDLHRFDDVTRTLGRASSRRTLLRLVFGGVGAFLFGNDEIEAKPKKRRKKRKKRCKPNCTGKVCGDDGCGGSCGECPGDIRCVVCENGHCQYALDGTLCEPDDYYLRCYLGRCVTCGSKDQPSCSGVCGPGTGKDPDGICRDCGVDGLPCCAGSACFGAGSECVNLSSGTMCVSSSCGHLDETCCPLPGGGFYGWCRPPLLCEMPHHRCIEPCC